MKIINLGLPKTGTTTLYNFLRNFFVCIHNNLEKTRQMQKNVEEGKNVYDNIKYDDKTYYECDCQPDYVLDDFCFFPQINNLENLICENKDTKFILTKRENADIWLESIKKTKNTCGLYYRILNNIQKIPILNTEFNKLIEGDNETNYDISLYKFYNLFIDYVRTICEKHNVELFELNIDSNNIKRDNIRFKKYISKFIEDKELLESKNIFEIKHNAFCNYMTGDKNAIVGYTGLVGSNLLQFYKFDYFYNSKNFIEAKNKSFDTVFFCGIPAVKWYANKNPEEDQCVIDNIKDILNTISAKKIVLISTIDVYENTGNCVDEDYEINPHENHTYGKNRFLFEEYIKSNFDDYHIIRLPALFGKGLKKNIIFDLIHNNNVNNIPINSEFQWYYLDWLKKDIDVIINNDIKACNLFTEPIHTQKIVEIFSEIYNIEYSFNDNSDFLQYNLCTKYNSLFNHHKPYVKNNEEIISALYDYFTFEQKDKSKLCVSNICVNEISQLQFASILKLFGIKNIQIAPTKIIESWSDLDNIDLSAYTDMNLNVYAFQSITYTLNHLNIFDIKTQDQLYKHLTKVIDCAEKHNVKVLVFGCPQNRKVLSSTAENDLIFIDFFKRIGKYLKGKNIVICIENNSKEYNCNYLNTIEECSNVVRQIDSDNIKMMVDLGNAIMENDKWQNLNNDMSIIYNIDISNPYMTSFNNMHESNREFNNVLKDSEYHNIMNLEFLIKDMNELISLRSSLTNFINTYAHTPK